MKKIMLLLALFLFISCGSDKKDVSKELSGKSAAELMEEIEKDEYTPPDDGKLSEKQVEMYIHVKKEELAYAKEAAQNLKEKSKQLKDKGKKGKIAGLREYVTAFKAMGDVANFVTADLRAAKKLGYNTKEYKWVREVIVNTNLAVWADTTTKVATDMYEKTLAELKTQRDSATTVEQKNLLDQQINSVEQALKQFEGNNNTSYQAIDYNKELLAKYKDEILGLQAEVKKWSLLNQTDSTSSN